MSRPVIRRRGDRLAGLPSKLPAGERILWQGRPDWRVLARHVLHIRALAFYLAAMLAWFTVMEIRSGRAGQMAAGVVCLAAFEAVALGVVALFARLLANTTVYTLTDQRVVLRFGIALSMSINLPLRLIDAAGLRLLPGGFGDIPLAMSGRQALGFLVLWPHVRPWRLSRPLPMLRAVPDAVRIAQLLTEALRADAIRTKTQPEEMPEGVPQEMPETAQAVPALVSA